MYKVPSAEWKVESAEYQVPSAEWKVRNMMNDKRGTRSVE